jgi:hypothetical protein
MINKAKTPKEVLIAARYILSHWGWCQGTTARDKQGRSLYSPKKHLENLGSVCAVGAISIVDTDFEPAQVAYNILDEVISDQSPSIVIYNDTPGRTKQEVLAVFDKAIQQAKY